MQLPVIRHLIVAGSILLALCMGWYVANGQFVLPGLVLALVVPLVASRWTTVPLDVIAAGALLVGYLVGNRGFAQLTLPGVPLLVGEAVLGLGVVFALWRTAWDKTAYVRRDTLNVALLLWIAVCTARLPADLRDHGFMAVRDFALVYYAVFFFLAQTWSAIPGARRFLEKCLSAGFLLCGPVAILFEQWPDVFARFAVRGVPVIFVKGDLAGAFAAAGVFWFAVRHARTGSRWQLVWSGVCAACVMLGNSRAAMVAVFLSAVLVLVLRERRIFRALLGFAAVGCLALLVEAALPKAPGQSSKAFRLYEALRTVVDISGTHVPLSEDLGDKPDNNRFRRVWWEAVIDETRAEGPVFGLGFGRDLADQFIRRYYVEDNDEFNVRSPHSFPITLFARTGLVGLGCFLLVLVAMAGRTLVAAGRPMNSGAGAMWLVPGTIFFASCFGVILEGPMGAAVFWTLLGLANAATAESATTEHNNADQHLHGGTGAPEVAAAS